MSSGIRLGVVDGLRGIAVLLVLWYHIWEISWLPAPVAWAQFIPETGFVGVALFFFISGFVIVYPFVRSVHEASAAPTWGDFAYRRARKIVPSYLLSIVFVIAIGYPEAHFASFGDAIRQIGAHLLFIHTWFPQTYGGINGVLWTLAVEVQFYAIFPLLWWCFKRQPYVTAVAMAAIAQIVRSYAAACCGSQGEFFENRIDNFPAYLDVFAAGMLCAQIFVTRRDGDGRAQRALATLVAVIGTIGFVLLLQNLWSTRTVDEWSSAWSVHGRTLIALAFLAIGAGSLLGARAWQRLLANPPLLWLALISYNLYLYHQVVARELLLLHIPPYRGDPHEDYGWQIAFTVVASLASIALAALVTYGFERPLLRVPLDFWLRRSRARQARVLTDA